jgi:hypothetical protein
MDKPMKRLCIALLLGLVVACGGDGGSDPTDPHNNTNPPMEVPDGTFAMTATKTVDVCGRSDVWAGDWELQFVDKTFTMGGFSGSWDASTGFARGETDKAVVVTRNCTLSDFSTAYLTFKSPNTFQGTIVYRHALKGSCPNLKGCSTTWIVNGTRVTR